MNGVFLVVLVCLIVPTGVRAQEKQSVFRQPIIMRNYLRQQLEADAALRAGKMDDARRLCEESIEQAPHYPGAHYLLARILAKQNRKDEAFASLQKAIDRGMSEPRHLQNDPDLESLRGDERFRKAVEAAGKAQPLLRWPAQTSPGKVRDGIVWIGEQNTTWDIRNGVFLSFLDKPAPAREKPVVTGFGAAGELLRKWYSEGTAAGHQGDFYDNHDEEHSNMSFQHFPQLTRIKFSKEVSAIPGTQFHRGLQVHFFYDGVVLGNASVAMVGQPFWRSMSRLACTERRAIGVLYNQYVNNHLYIYPEHRDHDPGQNGQPPFSADERYRPAWGARHHFREGGYGDVLPANTPYLITSQGSSGSDRVFLDAVACTLAAFRPEVKKELVRQKALMPTVQMIFRSSNRRVQKPEDYLSGKAHPSVFEGSEVDVVRMVKLAHDIQPGELPPLVRLRLVEEDQPVLGRDYFDAEPRGERLFDTPGSIARVMRSLAHTRRLVVSAEDSADLNGKPLTYQWVVLRGDPAGVTIRKLNPEGSRAELLVNWQERRPIEADSRMESNRIDIGVFVHNGKHHSAPAFVTFLSLDNQKRTYDSKKRIVEVDYEDPIQGKNYVDPVLDLKKHWRDVYEYDSAGRLIGWTRHAGKGKQEFTADGSLIREKDARGRASKAQTVRYVVKPLGQGRAPELEQRDGEEFRYYEYESNEDRVGKVKRRTGID